MFHFFCSVVIKMLLKIRFNLSLFLNLWEIAWYHGQQYPMSTADSGQDQLQCMLTNNKLIPK